MIRWISRRASQAFERMSGPLAAAAVAVIAGVVLMTSVAAQVPVQPSAGRVYSMGPGRIAAVVGVVVGLVGIVNGGRILSRSAHSMAPARRRRRAIVAMALGSIGLVIGGLVVASADGGVGTGNGVGGAVLAMIVGLAGVALGGLAFARPAVTRG